jgi:hypothetical protein
LFNYREPLADNILTLRNDTIRKAGIAVTALRLNDFKSLVGSASYVKPAAIAVRSEENMIIARMD